MTETREPAIVDPTVEDLLAQGLQQVPGLVGIVLADAGGLAMFSSFEEERGVPESSSMGAVTMDIGRRLSRHLALGSFENVTFAFQNRYLHLSTLSDGNALLLAVARKNVNLGLMYLALEDLKKVLERLLADFLFLEQ